ncbi:MAG: type II toxin-antitoxin system HicA family toxin [Gemmataceae bacterium]|nr:type II toxin-antitoxin system HicA family toxin [Gemmataceae bacterium]
MPSLDPVSRRKLIRKLKALGFQGPYAGGNHQWMQRDRVRLTIPNPHGNALDPGLIRRILRQGGISIQEWVDA